MINYTKVATIICFICSANALPSPLFNTSSFNISAGAPTDTDTLNKVH